MRENDLGSDHRISVHVNTPSDRIQWNVKEAEIPASRLTTHLGNLGMIAWCLPPYLDCKWEAHL